MNKKIIILIISLLLMLMLTVSGIIIYYKQRNHTSIVPAPSQKKHTLHKAPMPENISKKANIPDLPPLVQTKKEACNALPSYYGTPLMQGTANTKTSTKKTAQAELPSYYGTPVSFDQPLPTKQEIFADLSARYGATPYKDVDSTRNQELFSYEESDEIKQKTSLIFTIHADTFFTGSDNQALLNDSQSYDKAVFLQTIINLPLDIHIPAKEWGKIDFNFTGRINTLWGSNELSQTSREFVKIGRAITETKHYHEFDHPLFWVRETWLKIHSLSEKTMFQAGFFPKQIGLGLILGNHYKAGNPLLTSTKEKFIDQYRPGFELSTTFGKKDYKASLYYSLYKNNATSFDKQVEFTQGQELCECGDGPPFQRADPSRPLFQTSHLITAELDIPVDIQKTVDHKLHIKPFILYNKDRNQIVEFFGDAQSTLVTLGSAFTLKNNKVEIDFDIAGNLGFQEVKGWDRNVTEEHARMTLTHLFAKSFDSLDTTTGLDLASLLNNGEFVLSPTFPYPPEKDISLEHPAGAIFQENNPSLITPSPLNPDETINLNVIFQNSYSRFRKCYRNKYRSFMAATDIGYHISDKYKLGCILGYASGDDNPNDSREKAYLYRMRKDWDQVRQDFDHCYNGFIGIQSLYTGKHVRTMQLLRAHRLNEPLSQVPELTANQLSNMAYGGLGLWVEKEYLSGKLRFNTNIIGMGLVHQLKFGLDPVVQDVFETFDFKADEATEQRFQAYDKELSQFLGVEINAFLEFFAKNHLTFYGSVSVFLPGSYYNDIKNFSNLCAGKVIPLKNQYIAIAKEQSGFENAERACISLKNDTAVVAYAGVKFDFDTTSLYNPFRSKRKKKK